MAGSAPTTVAGRAGTTSRIAQRRAQVGLLVATVVAGLLTMMVATGSQALDGFDTALTDLTRGWADPLGWPVDVARVVGLLTDNLMSALTGGVLILILLVTRHPAAAALLTLSCSTGVLVSEVMKRALDRTRPPAASEFVTDLDQSFPSGHSMVGIFLYLAAGLVLIQLGRHHDQRWLRPVGLTLVVIGPCIGLSRLVLGVHWPSDIIGGWAFGSIVLLTWSLSLWWPLDRGWVGEGWRPPATAPPSPPGSGATPAAPAQ